MKGDQIGRSSSSTTDGTTSRVKGMKEAGGWVSNEVGLVINSTEISLLLTAIMPLRSSGLSDNNVYACVVGHNWLDHVSDWS